MINTIVDTFNRIQWKITKIDKAWFCWESTLGKDEDLCLSKGKQRAKPGGSLVHRTCYYISSLYRKDLALKGSRTCQWLRAITDLLCGLSKSNVIVQLSKYRPSQSGYTSSSDLAIVTPIHGAFFSLFVGVRPILAGKSIKAKNFRFTLNILAHIYINFYLRMNYVSNSWWNSDYPMLLLFFIYIYNVWIRVASLFS